jgi:hypothetical protein
VSSKQCRTEFGHLLGSAMVFDVCGLTETWFKPGTGDTCMKRFLPKTHMWIGRDRTHQGSSRRGHGGVGFVVRLGAGSFSLLKSSDSFDILWIKLARGPETFIFCAVYISPDGSPYGNYTAAFAELESDLLRFREQGSVC